LFGIWNLEFCYFVALVFSTILDFGFGVLVFCFFGILVFSTIWNFVTLLLWYFLLFGFWIWDFYKDIILGENTVAR